MTVTSQHHREKVASATRSATRRLWSHPLGEVFACGGRMLALVDVQATASEVQALRATLRGIGGKSILPVLDLRALSDGRVAVKSALPGGVTLAQRLACGALEPARAIGILRQLARALGDAHRVGRTHGALSLASVIVGMRDGRRDAVHVTDFGLGDLAWNERDREATGLPISPERALGLPREPAEDTYLFGCVAFAALTGRPVFDVADVAEARRRHAIEDAPLLRNLPRGQAIPDALRRFVARCLAKDPDDRFSSGVELEAALCEAQLEAEVVTAWDDLPPPSVDPARRRAIAEGLARHWSNETRREAAQSGVFLAPERGRHRARKTRSARSTRSHGRAVGVPRAITSPDRTPIVATRLLEPRSASREAGVPRAVPAELDRTPIVATVLICAPR